MRRHRLAVVAAVVPLAVLLATAVTAAPPPDGTSPRTVQSEQQTDGNPEAGRVSLASPGATFDLLGRPEPLGTGALTGVVDLSQQPGEQAVTTANLVLAGAGGPGADFGKTSVSLRPDSPADYRYNPAEEAIVVETGLEFQVERAPGIGVDGKPVFFYTSALRLLPTEAADPEVLPLDGRTFALPSPVLLWEGAAGFTGSEPVGMLSGLEITVTLPTQSKGHGA